MSKEELWIVAQLDRFLKAAAFKMMQAMCLFESQWWEPKLMTYWFNVALANNLQSFSCWKVIPLKASGIHFKNQAVTISRILQNLVALDFYFELSMRWRKNCLTSAVLVVNTLAEKGHQNLFVYCNWGKNIFVVTGVCVEYFICFSVSLKCTEF